MEINKDNFAEAIKNEEFTKTLLPLIAEIEPIQAIVNNKAESIYKSKIDDEVKKIHTQYDDDIFAILGERPGSKDGTKEKTYDFAKKLYSELKELRTKKETLEKDPTVVQLKSEIEKLKTEGGGKHIQEIFDKAKQDWAEEKKTLEDSLKNASQSSEVLKKSTEIAKAVSQIKFNPDIPESIQKIALKDAENYLIQNSKFENDELIFLDDKGQPMLDKVNYKPLNAFGVLTSLDSIKDISLKNDDNKGGGKADTKIHGSIQTTTVEGKDAKKLILPEGSFKTRTEFTEVAEKALLDSGVTRRDPEWDKLKNEAYKELKVSELPA